MMIVGCNQFVKKTMFETYAGGNTEGKIQKYLDEVFTLDKCIGELKDPDVEFYFAMLDDSAIGYLKNRIKYLKRKALLEGYFT